MKHARYYWLLLAESHLTRQLFAGMLRKITMLLSYNPRAFRYWMKLPKQPVAGSRTLRAM